MAKQNCNSSLETEREKLGKRLEQARTTQRLSKKASSRQTQISTAQIESFESGNWQDGVYNRGLVQTYARYLGIVVEWQQAKESATKTQTEPLLRSFVTSRISTILLIGLIFCGLFGYVGYQVYQFTKPPELAIEVPKNLSAKTDSDFTIVRGRTDEDAEVSINGISVGTQEDGKFDKRVYLSKGKNELLIEAVNQQGKRSHETVIIISE
ncbi:helix-turn-helix domain-containing protein [Candidatus Saccharibacteria bacterium]|nr:helix-turn-helix domain-containing protein [Candidatus Saccharibacteria bacterium]